MKNTYSWFERQYKNGLLNIVKITHIERDYAIKFKFHWKMLLKFY